MLSKKCALTLRVVFYQEQQCARPARIKCKFLPTFKLPIGNCYQQLPT